MNSLWREFLISRNATISEEGVRFKNPLGDGDRLVYPIVDQGILSVSGNDAEKFLQGQITCDIRAVTDNASCLGAICNPKGRVVTTFRAIRRDGDYWLIMPAQLLEAIKKRLQMYVLRADVKLADISSQWALMGVYGDHPDCVFETLQHPIPQNTDDLLSAPDGLIVRLRADRSRYQIIATPERACAIWRTLCESEDFAEFGTDFWRRHEILNGICTVTPETSEEFVPQMLNLDVLGGISFNKGCYTGQEIVARMHYLGHLKRRMFLIRCPEHVPSGAGIFDATESQQSVGTVVVSTLDDGPCYALAVLQVSHLTSDLRLDSPDGKALSIPEQPYALPGITNNEPVA